MQNLPNRKEAVFQQIATQLQSQGLRVSQRDESRPWGGFFVIDEDQAIKFLETYFLSLDKNEIIAEKQGWYFHCGFLTEAM